MNETPREPPPPEIERVERHEVIERAPGSAASPTERRTAPMWAWLLPLVLIVIALVWYVLSTGEPSSPIEALPDVDIEAPAISEPEAPGQ